MDIKDYIFGTRAIIEALEAGKTLDKIMVKRDGSNVLLNELFEKAKIYNVPVIKVPVEKLNRITRKNHQGAIAILSPVTYHKLEDLVPEIYEKGDVPFCVMLDGVTDARNFGAIARTCECAGVDFIVIPERNSASVTSDSVKASAGALFHIPVCREKDLSRSVSFLKDSGYKIIGASEKAIENYTETDMKVPLAIVMGAEDTGISIDILRKCDDLVSIPIRGKIGSLNVGVATGVLVYEVVRQRYVDKK